MEVAAGCGVSGGLEGGGGCKRGGGGGDVCMSAWAVGAGVRLGMRREGSGWAGP